MKTIQVPAAVAASRDRLEVLSRAPSRCLEALGTAAAQLDGCPVAWASRLPDRSDGVARHPDLGGKISACGTRVDRVDP